MTGVVLLASCDRDAEPPPLPVWVGPQAGVPMSEWTVFADDPEHLFEQARRAYFAGDTARAAETIHRSTRALTIWAHRTDDGPAKSTLYLANSRLRGLADDVEHHQLTRADLLDRPFAFAHYALARSHAARAKALSDTEPQRAGQGLIEAVSHLQFGMRWAGHDDVERDADREADVMLTAVRMVTGQEIDSSVVASALVELDQELGRLERAARHATGGGVELPAEEQPAIQILGHPLVVFSDEPDRSFHEAIRFIGLDRPHGAGAEVRLAAAWIDLMAGRSEPVVAQRLFTVVRELEDAARHPDRLDEATARQLFASAHRAMALAALDLADAAVADGKSSTARDMCHVAGTHLWSAGLWRGMEAQEQPAIRTALAMTDDGSPGRNTETLDALVQSLRAAAVQMSPRREHG